MSKAVAKRKDQVLATGDDNYAEFYKRSSGESVLHMKYQKGAYNAGAEGVEIPIGTHMLANLPLVENGWLKWQGGTVVEQRMQLVSDGSYPYREDLPDLDSRLWEVDEATGRPMDPWVESYKLPLRDVETQQDYSFSTSSFGGRKAVGQAIWTWRKAVKAGQTGCPIIVLGTDTYKHRKYGLVHFPVLPIVGWEGEDTPPEPKPKKRRSKKAPAEADRAKLDDELNDELPDFAQGGLKDG